MREKNDDSSFNLKQFENIYPDNVNLHYWNRGRNRIIKRKVSSFLKPNGTILEIGCGRGVVVEYLRSHGFDCWGCDSAVVKPISNNISEYLCYSTNAFSLQESFCQTVDALLLLDVLEHLSQPKEFLSECLEKFQNLHNILITLPARMELWSNYDEYNQHLMRYDNKTLDRLLEAFSFKKIDIGYFFHLIYMPARFCSILKIPRSIKFMPPELRISTIAHDFMAQFFNVEEKIVPKWIPGTSIFAVVNIK